MFKKLMEFDYDRTPKEAFGFYVAYLVLCMLLSGLAAGILSIFSIIDDSFQAGLRVGTIIAVIVSVFLSLFVLSEKKLLNKFPYLLLVILSGVLAFYIGGLGGLIPVAFLTTRKSKIEEAIP